MSPPDFTALARRLAGRISASLSPRQPAAPVVPVNLRRRDASEAAIAADVDYGMQVVRGFSMWMQGAGFDVRGARVLELGPGVNLAGTLGLKALGAGEAIAADRWLAAWESGYTPVFCRAMSERIRREEPTWDAGVFEQAARSGYDGLITLVQSGAESLPAAIDGQVDAILSNAVLEHVADHAAMARALFAVTKPGGVGLHQVDFRYHVDFSRPFEHLLEPPDAFLRAAQASSFEMGCQIRPAELALLFEAAGFSTSCYPGSPADEAYFTDFLLRLRASPSAYREAAEAMLKPLDAYYILRRP